MTRPDSPHDRLDDPRDKAAADPRVAPAQVGDAPSTGGRRPGAVTRFFARRSLLALGAAGLALIVVASVVTAIVVNHKPGELPAPQVMASPGAVAETSDCAPTAEGAAARGDSGPREGMEAASAQNFAVSTANPLASEAACRVLADGGSAADGLIAAQAVLGLV